MCLYLHCYPHRAAVFIFEISTLLLSPMACAHRRCVYNVTLTKQLCSPSMCLHLYPHQVAAFIVDVSVHYYSHRAAVSVVDLTASSRSPSSRGRRVGSRRRRSCGSGGPCSPAAAPRSCAGAVAASPSASRRPAPDSVTLRYTTHVALSRRTMGQIRDLARINGKS